MQESAPLGKHKNRQRNGCGDLPCGGRPEVGVTLFESLKCGLHFAVLRFAFGGQLQELCGRLAGARLEAPEGLTRG